MKYTRITLRIPEDLHQKLAQSSELSSKSMNAEIIGRLNGSFEQADVCANTSSQVCADIATKINKIIELLSNSTSKELDANERKQRS